MHSKLERLQQRGRLGHFSPALLPSPHAGHTEQGRREAAGIGALPESGLLQV